MNKTKIVTFRMEKDLLQDVDAFATIHYYWKRTYIIVAIIWAFFRLASAGTRFTLMKLYFSRKKNYRIKLEEIEPNNENPED